MGRRTADVVTLAPNHKNACEIAPSTAQTYGCGHSIGGIGLGGKPNHRNRSLRCISATQGRPALEVGQTSGSVYWNPYHVFCRSVPASLPPTPHCRFEPLHRGEVHFT